MQPLVLMNVDMCLLVEHQVQVVTGGILFTLIMAHW